MKLVALLVVVAGCGAPGKSPGLTHVRRVEAVKLAAPPPEAPKPRAQCPSRDPQRDDVAAIFDGPRPTQTQTEIASGHGCFVGAIQGQVVDASSNEPLAGVTVVVTAHELGGARTEMTDDKGSYRVDELPPGDYVVTFTYGQLSVGHREILVKAMRATPVFQKLHVEPPVHVNTDPSCDYELCRNPMLSPFFARRPR